MHDHAKKFGAEIVTDMVESVRKGGDGVFEVRTARGRVYRAPTVILTAGGTPVELGVPGEKEDAGEGVSYCAGCDGAFFKARCSPSSAGATPRWRRRTISPATRARSTSCTGATSSGPRRSCRSGPSRIRRSR